MSTLGAAGGIYDFNSLAVGVQQSSMTFHKEAARVRQPEIGNRGETPGWGFPA